MDINQLNKTTFKEEMKQYEEMIESCLVIREYQQHFYQFYFSFIDKLMDRKEIDELLIKRYMRDPQKNKIFSTKDNEPIGEMKIIKVNQNSLNNSQVKEGISLIDTKKLNQNQVKRVHTSPCIYCFYKSQCDFFYLKIESYSLNKPQEKYQSINNVQNLYSPIKNNDYVKADQYQLNNQYGLLQTEPSQQQFLQTSIQHNQPLYSSQVRIQNPMTIQSPQKSNFKIYDSSQNVPQLVSSANPIFSAKSLDFQTSLYQNEIYHRQIQPSQVEINQNSKFLFDGPNPLQNVKRKQDISSSAQKSSTQNFFKSQDYGQKKPVKQIKLIKFKLKIQKNIKQIFDVSTPFVGKQNSYQASRRSSIKGQEYPQMYLRDEISPINQNYNDNYQFGLEENNNYLRDSNSKSQNDGFVEEFDEFQDFVIESNVKKNEVQNRNTQSFESSNKQSKLEKEFQTQQIKQIEQQPQSNQNIKKLALALILFLVLLIIFILIK